MWLKHMGRPVFAIAGQSVVLGRGIDADLRLTMPDISRRHCRFDRTADGVTVTDLGSLNGTLVNGVAIEGPTLLAHDDTVQVGQFRFDVDLTLALVDESAA